MLAHGGFLTESNQMCPNDVVGAISYVHEIRPFENNPDLGTTYAVETTESNI